MANSNQVVLIIASTDYQPIEYQIPKHLIEQAGFTVITASDTKGTAVATDGTTTTAGMTVSEIDPENFDALIFIGGTGALDALDNTTSYNLIRKAHDLHKVIGAICLATRILAKAGILEDRAATGWNGDHQLESLYKQHDVHFKPKDVMVDDEIVTASGPQAAREFAENIISLLAENKD